MSSSRTLRLAITGEHTDRDPVLGDVFRESNGIRGQVRSCLDMGRVDGVLNAVDLERHFELIEDDEAAKAAAQLSALGWKAAELGGLFHPRLAKGRPGRRLVEDAILVMAAKDRQQRLEFEAKRRELRA